MKMKIGDSEQDLGRLWPIAPPFLIGILSPILLSRFFIGASGPKAPCWDYDTVSPGGGAAAGIGVSTTFCLSSSSPAWPPSSWPWSVSTARSEPRISAGM